MQGILKTGSDNRYCMYVDIVCQWIIAIPLAIIAAFIWKLPLFVIFLIIQIEEICKISPCLYRV